ncbi:MAG: OB-fold domain-containing protein [Parvularculaceae bacterium]|nr:OB-fold domain-containing protein [Parvularculaceae bacterium]
MQPIAEGLFTDETSPRLIGGRNRLTGALTFPRPPDDRYEAVPLSRTGAVWSFTVQRFRPKSPPYAGSKDFAPYAVAYVELPGELIVEGRLTGVAFEDIRIGMPVELTLVPLDPAKADSPLIHAFRPRGDGAAS